METKQKLEELVEVITRKLNDCKSDESTLAVSTAILAFLLDGSMKTLRNHPEEIKYVLNHMMVGVSAVVTTISDKKIAEEGE